VPATHTRSFVLWLLFAVLALIAYGSLYPFNFKPDAIEGGMFEALRQLSWARAGRGDRISNVLLYLPLGFCLFLWLEMRLRRVPSLVLATTIGALVSLAIEVAQVYVSRRVPSLTDLVLNTSGTLLGAAGGWIWQGLSALMHLPARAEKPARDPGARVVLALWLAWRFAPFVPEVDLAKLKAALRPLFSPQIDPIAVFVYLTCWLVVNQAISALAIRPRRLEILLLVIAAVLVGRLLVASQSLVPAELLALLLLLPLVVLMHRLSPRPRRAALMLAVATVLIIEGLAPFDFTPPTQGFDLWPFVAWFEMGVPAAVQAFDWVELFGKLFLFAALAWTIKQWGASIGVAIAAVPGMALLIELLQMWLPQQHASIADPLLALAVGLVLRALYRRLQPREFARDSIVPRARSR
jgi:VanZ family protein